MRRYSPAVITDPVPRAAGLRRQYEASDAQHTLELPPAEPLQQHAERLRVALEAAQAPGVRRAGQELLDHLADFYRVPAPRLKILGVRPHRVRDGHLESELHGDYTLATGVLRAWMRTAILGKVTSYRGMLNTLLHEFAHHLTSNSSAIPKRPTRGGSTGGWTLCTTWLWARPPTSANRWSGSRPARAGASTGRSSAEPHPRPRAGACRYQVSHFVYCCLVANERPLAARGSAVQVKRPACDGHPRVPSHAIPTSDPSSQGRLPKNRLNGIPGTHRTHRHPSS